MNLKDKVILITGASSGIGEAAARLLARKEGKVALAARSADKLKALAANLPDAFAQRADMTKANEIREMVRAVHKHYGRIDILVNNAGQGYSAPTERIDREKYRYLYELNVVGPLLAMQAVIPLIREQGGGTIVNISSGTTLRPLSYVGAYASTKRALNGLTLSAREELKADKIAVCLVYPYITDNDFYRNRIGAQGDNFAANIRNNPNLQPPDSSEYVAEVILKAIESGAAETYAHDWMKKWE